MTVTDFCLVQGKSIVRGTLGMLLGTPQLLRLKGSPLYWKALHHCLLCMSSHLLLDLLLHGQPTLFLVKHTSSLCTYYLPSSIKPGSAMRLRFQGTLSLALFSCWKWGTKIFDYLPFLSLQLQPIPTCLGLKGFCYYFCLGLALMLEHHPPF